MAARTFALATALVLGLTGLAQAQARTTWQEPGPARAGEAPAARAVEAPAAARDAAPVRREAQAEPPRERPQMREERPAPRARARAERRREVRSARYRGGSGATWKTGRDTHGFAGSYGGCRFRGFAGPNGYRLDRSC